jgi:hypothetical protein
MIDAQNEDTPRPFVDLVDDAVRPPTSCMETCQLPPERMADPVRIIEQRAEHELDHRGRGLRGEARQRPVHGGGHDQLPRARTHRPPR